MATVAGAVYLPGFVPASGGLLEVLVREVTWDDRMRARRTASMGEPYDYSGIHYAREPWHPEVAGLRALVDARLGYASNNALLNLYPTGESAMGWHSDDVAILAPGTGVAVVSLGGARPLTFRRRTARADVTELLLESGSLLYMLGEMQREWQHALPPAPTQLTRISLTFRAMRVG